MTYHEWILIIEFWTLVDCCIVPTTTEPTDLQSSLRKHLIIPDLLRIGPNYALYLRYGNSSVAFGSKFTPDELEKEPNSLQWIFREGAFHTLVVVGLDVPTQKNHTEREWNHWILVNIPENNITEGETIVPYQGPGSPYDTGSHRIVFMVYEQPWRHTISFSEKAFADSPVRRNFDSSRFAEKYDIGNPVAVNFLICEIDRAAPTKMTN